jgi:hypothetical protein
MVNALVDTDNRTYPAGELRWNDDGAHLDERSAVMVASVLANAISKKLAGK